jgi:hypothetical protein
VRLHADSAFEQFQEPESGEPDKQGEIFQNDFVGNMRVDEFPDKPQLLRPGIPDLRFAADTLDGD